MLSWFYNSGFILPSEFKNFLKDISKLYNYEKINIYGQHIDDTWPFLI
jgi:hypothetical protein